MKEWWNSSFIMNRVITVMLLVFVVGFGIKYYGVMTSQDQIDEPIRDVRGLEPEEMSVGGISLDSELGDVVKIYGEPQSKREYVRFSDGRGNVRATSDLRQVNNVESMSFGSGGHFVEYKYQGLTVTARAHNSNGYSQLNNKNLPIRDITVTAKNLSTPAGIHVGGTVGEMKRAYGEGAEHNFDGEIMYSYGLTYKSSLSLSFTAKNGIIIAIDIYHIV